jgi:hypothetical protein
MCIQFSLRTKLDCFVESSEIPASNELAMGWMDGDQVLFVVHLNTEGIDCLETLRRELRLAFSAEVMAFRNVRYKEGTDTTVVFHRLVGHDGLRDPLAFLKATARKLNRAVQRALGT